MGLVHKLATAVANGSFPEHPIERHNSVQLLSDQFCSADDLHPGQHGMIVTVNGDDEVSLLTPEQRLQRMIDELDLRQLYSSWYRNGGGRQVEKALVAEFKRAVPKKLEHHIAARFQDIVRAALKILEDEGDQALLDVCMTALTAHGKFDPIEFVNLHKMIVGCNSSIAHDEQLLGTKAGLRVIKDRASAKGYDHLAGTIRHVVPILADDLAAKVP